MKGNRKLSCIIFPVLIFIFLTSFYPSDIEGGVLGKETEQEVNKEKGRNYVQEQVGG